MNWYITVSVYMIKCYIVTWSCLRALTLKCWLIVKNMIAKSTSKLRISSRVKTNKILTSKKRERKKPRFDVKKTSIWALSVSIFIEDLCGVDTRLPGTGWSLMCTHATDAQGSWVSAVWLSWPRISVPFGCEGWWIQILFVFDFYPGTF